MAFNPAVLFQHSKKVSAGLVIMLLTLLMYVSAAWFYGAQYLAAVQQVYVIYLILALVVMVSTGMKFSTLSQKPGALINFVVMFIITIPFALALTTIFHIGASIETVMTVISFGFLWAFVKAYIEEGVFRDILPKFLTPIGSNIAFGLFHIGMLSLTAGVLVSSGALAAGAAWIWIAANSAVLFMLGMVWQLVYYKYGMLGSTGSHFAYNAVSLGVFSGLSFGALIHL